MSIAIQLLVFFNMLVGAIGISWGYYGGAAFNFGVAAVVLVGELCDAIKGLKK